jgi:membrane carboxypeptidase/penicillin-binding protein PbpC
MFGANSVLALPFSAAAKTGTSNDYRDNWTLGYTPDLTVGVWVGNADYSPMQDISGVTGAAPIWAEFMKYAVPQLTGGNPTGFTKPSGIVDRVICSISGTEPSQWCPSQRSEYFAADQLPLPSTMDLWTKVVFDTWTGLRASASCSSFTKEEYALNITDSWAIGWIQNNPEGKDWANEMGFNDPLMFAPSRDCSDNDPHPNIELSLTEGQTITSSPLDINGKIDVASDFQDFKIEYGVGEDPGEWKELMTGNQPINQVNKIYSWDINSIPPGVVTIKVTMHSVRGGYAERKIHININVPTPTPTVTPTLIPTATPTLMPSPTATDYPTNTPDFTPTPTSFPTETQPPSFINP